MKYLVHVLFSLLIIIFLSGCCPCDCAGYADFNIEFFDIQTGQEIEITPSCNGVGRIADIQLVDEPLASYSYSYCGNNIYMTHQHRNSDLCSDKQLKFNILYDGEIVETVLAGFRDTANNCCDCEGVCIYVEKVRQDSLGVTFESIDIGAIRVEI